MQVDQERKELWNQLIIKGCLFTIEFKFVRKRERFYGHDMFYLGIWRSHIQVVVRKGCRKRRRISLT